MDLGKLQQQFRNLTLGAKPLGRELESIAHPFRSGGVALEHRLQVYHNNIMISLIDAVVAAYPMVEKLVGVEFFRQAVNDYVLEQPPKHGNLNAYGETFPEFIRNYPAAADLLYLADMAYVEWSWEAAYYARDEQPLDAEMLLSIPNDELPLINFRPLSSMSLVASRYPLDEIVDFCRSEDPQPSLDISNRGAWIQVIRRGYQVQLHRLKESDYQFLSAMQSGRSVGQAAEEILVSNPNVDLASLIRKHLGSATFSGFQLLRN